MRRVLFLLFLVAFAHSQGPTSPLPQSIQLDQGGNTGEVHSPSKGKISEKSLQKTDATGDETLRVWKRQVDLAEKTQWKENVKIQLIRSEIMFFVSLPFFYLALNLLYGDGGSARFKDFPSGYSVLSTEVAYWRKVSETADRSKDIIERPVYPREVFNSTEFFVIFATVLWSFAVSFNNLYESLVVKDRYLSLISIGDQRITINFFTQRF